MKLFMWLTMFEACEQFEYWMSAHICDLNLHKLFAYTVFFSNDYNSIYKSLEILTFMATTIGYFATAMTICLSYSLCIDLILMLRQPLSPKESRILYYYSVSVAISAIVTMLSWFDENSYWCCMMLRFFVWGLFDTFFLMVPISICYAWHKLSLPGLSRQVRSLILSRHIITMTFFMIVNSYVFLSWSVALWPGAY